MIEVKFEKGERYKRIIGKLYQWDRGRSVIITGPFLGKKLEAHFAQEGDSRACRTELEVRDGAVLVELPNSFLMEAKAFYLYLYQILPGKGRTEYTLHFTVNPRARPDGYSEPDPPDSYRELLEKLKGKADSLSLEGDTLQLLSEGKKIGQAQVLPSGSAGSITNEQIDNIMKGE